MIELFSLLLKHVGTADVILDIGCADASELDDFDAVFPAASVYLFEPDARWHAEVVAKIKNKKAKFFPVAIAACDGLVDYYQSSYKYSSSIRAPKQHLIKFPHITFSEPTKINALSLDTWFKASGLSYIDLIWADVQGAEGDLIDGGQEALAKTRYLYTEYDDIETYVGEINLQQILQKLPKFKLVDTYVNNVLLKNTGL